MCFTKISNISAPNGSIVIESVNMNKVNSYKIDSIAPHTLNLGAKVDWDFRISDLVKNPDGTDV